MKLILGRKLGMTRVFNENSHTVGVSLIAVGPCYVTAVQTAPGNNRQIVQIGYQEARKLNKPQTGHQKKLNPKFKKLKYLREFKTSFEASDASSAPKVGDEITVEIFKPGDKITVSGVSKGKGFAGVVKRHHFAGGPASHGSDQHRAPGSIGAQAPQRVLKGRRMAGRMGFKRTTVKDLEIIDVYTEKNIIAVSGPVPGPKKSLLEIIKQ